MYYAIISQDVTNSLALRKQTRSEHLARLKDLDAQGRILIAGPHPIADSDIPDEQGFSGSLVVAKFESLTEAQAWADSDPYLLAGVYENVTVKPFIKVLP